MYPSHATSIPVNMNVHMSKDINGFPTGPSGGHTTGYSPAHSPARSGTSPVTSGRVHPGTSPVRVGPASSPNTVRVASSSGPGGAARVHSPSGLVSNSVRGQQSGSPTMAPTSNSPGAGRIPNGSSPGPGGLEPVPFQMAPMNMNMNDQMRHMESEMQRMQQHMQNTFNSFPGAPPPPPNSFNGFPGAPPPLIGPGQPFPALPMNTDMMASPMNTITSQNGDVRSQGSLTPNGMNSPVFVNSSALTPGGVDIGRAITPPPMDMRPLTPDVSGSPSQGMYPGDMMTTGRDGKKQLKLQFNMQDFNPDDVQVTANKNRLEVSAHHEEKEPNRVSCRVFHQKYELPQDVRLAKTQSYMTPEGRLDVESKVKPNYRVKFVPEEQNQYATIGGVTMH